MAHKKNLKATPPKNINSSTHNLWSQVMKNSVKSKNSEKQTKIPITWNYKNSNAIFRSERKLKPKLQNM